MSAWYILSALGFYPVDPASGNYVFGTPLFDRVVVELGDNKQLVIETRRKSPEDKYIQSVTFNGELYKKVWFSHSQITTGAQIVFEMGGQPNNDFGAEESAAPPSLNLKG
jgi:putative alpha-1,2-mannosidase